VKAAGWLALGAGAGLGFLLASCFNPPQLGGPFQCDQQGRCELPGYSCVDGVCCKTDGGSPACSPITPNDGGEDGGSDGGGDSGSDGGTDAGSDSGTPDDAGCLVPSNPHCDLLSLKGLCRDGGLVCNGGPTPVCTPIVTPRTETCDGQDEDCDGYVDNYPCSGGPSDFLNPLPGPDFVSGAMVASKDLLQTYGSCLLNDTNTGYTRTPGYLDGGNWRASGSVSHFAYFQKDGGTWDLTGQVLHLSISGVVLRGNAPLNANFFVTYHVPIVYLCGTGSPEGYRRYYAMNPNLVGWSGNTFTLNTTIDLTNGGGDWFGQSGNGPLDAVQRVEIVFAMQDAGALFPIFDAGITRLGFSPP